MDLGTLTVTIKAIDQGVSATLNKVKSQVKAASKSMDALGGKEKVFNKLGKGCQKIGKSLTNHITKPAIAAATALAGIVLVKGWNRLKQIDGARVKLEGLGHSATEVDNIMNNCLTAVKGTAFGLDEAATVAASAVAAGVKEGEQLEGYLTTVANVAAISGSSMQEIGSIFNKVKTAGKLSMEEVNQLSDRGVPVLQELSKEFGVTNQEMRTMISNGEVSADDLVKALDYSGAAVVMGTKSMTGALANVWASIGRIGANFLDAGGTGKGFFTAMKPLLAQLTEWLGVVELKAIDVGTAFGESFNAIYTYLTTGVKGLTVWNEETQEFETQVGGLGKTANTVLNTLQPLLDRIKQISDLIKEHPKEAGMFATFALSIGPVLSIIGTLLSTIGSIMGVFNGLATAAATAGTSILGLIGPIAGVVTVIAGIVAVFAIAYAKSEEFRNAINNLASTIGSILTSILTALIPLFQTLVQVITEVATAIAPLITLLGQYLAQALQAAMPLIQAMVSGLIPVITIAGQLVAAFAKIVTAIVQFVASSAPVKAMVALIGAQFKSLGTILSKMGSFFQGVSDKISEFVKDNSKIKSAIDTICSGFGLISPVVEKAKQAFDSLKEKWDEVLAQPAKKVYSAVQQRFDSVKSKAKSLFTQWKKNLGQKGTKIYSAVKKSFETVRNGASRLFNQWKKNLSQTGKKTYSVAKKGFETVKSAMGSLKSAWQSVLNMSGVKTFTSIFKKKGNPSSPNGEHRVGLQEVPYDGYLAALHKGETVLTAAETNQYKKWLNSAANKPFEQPKEKTLMSDIKQTVYNIGDVSLEVSKLEDVTTLEDIVTVFKQAKAFA